MDLPIVKYTLASVQSLIGYRKELFVQIIKNTKDVMKHKKGIRSFI